MFEVLFPIFCVFFFSFLGLLSGLVFLMLCMTFSGNIRRSFIIPK